MRTDATSIPEYLDTMAPERRQAIEAVRKVILDNLPDGYEEAFNWGMITYQVPLETYSNTYNGQPLMYAALGNQKNYMAVYLTGIYTSERARQEFEDAYRATGKRCDIGKTCVRFRKLDDLPLELIGRSIASLSVSQFVDIVEKAGSVRKGRR